MKARRGMPRYQCIDHVRVELGAWWKELLKRVIERLPAMKYVEGNWNAEALKELIELEGQIEEIVEEAAGDPSAK